ncbi:MAG: DUF721 domain-containing protein [Alphaproteobacteria bacterium]|jgi:hypothetical protein|nr:DUF721 domain-containing protein [Alphaproteobacteria bacterium]
MVTRSSLDPVSEARARVALRYSRARSVKAPPPDIGRVAAKYARKTLPEAGSGLQRLKSRWAEIVGDSIAKYCEPEKITGGKAGRTLTVRVIPQAAPVIQHRSGEIRQRVSVAAGGDIARLKIVQGPLSGTRPEASKPRARSLSPQELAWLDEGVKPIEDPALRAAIVALGKAVLSAEG